MRWNRAWDTEGKRNRLYGRRWRKARAAFLAEHPFCCLCDKAGKRELAKVVDHITPHKGDETLFWDQANWQPLCTWHHNSEKARIEIRGYSDRIGEDGWPLDPDHPANSGKEPISGRSRPDGLRSISVPVHLVVGAPASGKSTWCKAQAMAGDVVIDLEDIEERLTGMRRRHNRLLIPLLRERNKMILDAASMTSGSVFILMGLANRRDWDWWRKALGSTVRVVVVMATLDDCIARIADDPERIRVRDELSEAAHKWFERHDPDGADLIVDGGGALKDQNGVSGHRRPQMDIYLVSNDLDDEAGFA